MQRLIDPWVNVNMGEAAGEAYLQAVRDDYFKGGSEFLRNIESAELLDMMDHLGVEKALITVNASNPDPRVVAFTDDHPGRFFLAAVPDLERGAQGLWDLEALAEAYPVAMARVAPFLSGIAPSDALYYPLYQKCLEMALPLGINTGICGPPMPSECQHPIHLDQVAYRFPELTLIMQHGADPWWDVAIRLMIKYRNLFLMTSAYAPKYFPDSLVHYMRTRGGKKILFASDHPVLSIERCRDEALALDLENDTLDAFLYGNANRLLFSPRSPRYRKLKIDTLIDG